MTAIELVEQSQMTTRPDMKSGDTIRVHVKVREGDKERIQIFEGIVIGMHRGGARASFTVRKVSFGQGVERIFPLHSPTIAKVDLVRSARVRRAKLYFLRDLKGKAARMKETKRSQQEVARQSQVQVPMDSGPSLGVAGWRCERQKSLWFERARCGPWKTPCGDGGSIAWPGATKWGAAAWPGRSSRPPSSSTRNGTFPACAIPR